MNATGKFREKKQDVIDIALCLHEEEVDSNSSQIVKWKEKIINRNVTL